ncbi:DUF4065 domain-containing protein [Arachnia propionica]|uniref:DUF4065 domain-containing protein n=1 Tax=Arachnia propionica TaxID=1750 RepID=A0A3P1TAH0_9ACTN|nr:type II toxin-antitoxin system antitoxin SocA domain-containing protein [Arachnia propionica]RRD06298.1 DUF4065 domain-containing protein [Arachnia propionica]
MTTALDVLKYINEKHSPLNEAQYQKWLYYVQGWSLAWHGTPMFEDRIEAWAMGPVVPTVRSSCHVNGPSDLSPERRATIDAVVDHYRAWTGGELSDRAHRESPWLEARGPLPEGARSTAEVTRESMLWEFTAQSLRGQGPKKPPLPHREPDSDSVLELASRASRRWSHTLALLAE